MPSASIIINNSSNKAIHPSNAIVAARMTLDLFFSIFVKILPQPLDAFWLSFEFETVCVQEDDGTITEAQVPVYTGDNTKQLTENQIYSTNAILESQQEQEKKEKTLNYVYRDYYLYGIDVKDKPQPGGREGSEGVLATYDSKKGKREYNEPTRLTKFRLELTDQDYNLLDLNGIDIELTLNIDTETFIE